MPCVLAVPVAVVLAVPVAAVLEAPVVADLVCAVPVNVLTFPSGVAVATRLGPCDADVPVVLPAMAELLVDPALPLPEPMFMPAPERPPPEAVRLIPAPPIP